MAGTIANVNHRPVWVIYNDVDLGYVDEGDITITFGDSWVEQKTHQTGDMNVEAYLKRGPVTINIRLLETDNLSNWSIAFPYGEEQEDTSTPPETRFAHMRIADLTSDEYSGMKASGIDAQLRIVPTDEYDGTPSNHFDHEFVIHSAYVSSVGDMAFSVDSAQVMDLTFSSLFSPVGNNMHWCFGPAEPTTGAFLAS